MRASERPARRLSSAPWACLALALTITAALPRAALSGEETPVDPTSNARPANRLAKERSPYLLQHAHNPVDWYPWGDEAFALAKAQDRPVFLSVGYSACHWCHVMERESFEDDEVARFLSERFVSVKVDREERPDVDEVYMRVTQMITGSGGWPMTVFMTPDKRPFFAGTYFPKEARFGTIGFLSLLKKIDEAWRTRRGDVEESASEISRAASQAGASEAAALPAGASLSPASVSAVAAALERRFDPREGGFGGAPKFPPHQSLRLLIEQRSRVSERAQRMVWLTLDKMAQGGIHDHVGGGFARYSVDDGWHVPHFEKMLYDNAQLARAYADAWAVTRTAAYREAVEGIFAWTLREMTDALGGFYSALDADSEGVEGKFYLWTPSETAAVLGAERAKAFDAAYDITAQGNWEHGKSIPRLTLSRASGAEFADDRAKLLEARARRVRPHLDDKVLASWNGLMIGALARGSEVFGEPRWRAAAEKAARFILTRMRDGKGRLLRVWRKGEAGQRAFLDDHAFLADGLLDLHAATHEKEWLDGARGLCDAILRDFEDTESGGGFFASAHDAEPLLFRSKEPFDGATPNDNAVAVRALLRLAAATGDARYGEAADRALRALGGAILRAPAATATLAGALCLRGEEALAPAPPSAAGTEAGTATASAAPAADVTATAWIEGGPLRPGAGAALRARVTIRAPLYVSAPLASVTITSDLPVEAGPATAGEPEQVRLPYEEAPKAIYRGSIELRAPLRCLPEARPGSRGVLRLMLRYQACDDRACRPITELPLEIPLEVGQ